MMPCRDAYPSLALKAAALLESLTKNRALASVVGVAEGSISLDISAKTIAAHLVDRR
ncbi:MAG: hypothetical protein HOQ07_09175 [Sinomonas sp.]|nr:hypothetical protein [Sinomonas sp.]